MIAVVKTVVLDAHALLVFLEEEPGWNSVLGFFERASVEDVRLLLCVVNWGEMLYIVRRRFGAERMAEIVTLLDKLPLQIVPVDRALALQAAVFKAAGGISFSDCFAAALAHREDARLVTGDAEFREVEDTVDIEWLPPVV